MYIISTIIIGFLVGLVARFVKPGRDSFGFLATTLIGIVGAFIGSYIGQVMGIYHVGEPAGFLGAVLGAVIVLALIHASNRRRLV